MLDLYARVRCPVLIINGTAAELGAGPDWIKELMAAYRKGIQRDLAELAGRRVNIRVANLSARHALVFEQPHAVADEILTFLRSGSGYRIREPTSVPKGGNRPP